MMNRLENAARQALEALELSRPARCGQSDKLDVQEQQAHRKAITDLREALAEQQAAEPAFHIKADALAMMAPPMLLLHGVTLYGYGAEGTVPVYTKQPLTIGPLARRRIFDYIRGAYDLGYNDARNAKAVPGDGAPGYKGRDVEADHGGALLHALEALGAQTTQQPLTDEQIKALASALEAKGDTLRQFARAVEAAHGITSKEGGAA